MQHKGSQHYLGTFDSEIEAAKAYDRKALQEKHGKAQTNFDENGVETTVCQTRSKLQSYHSFEPEIYYEPQRINNTFISLSKIQRFNSNRVNSVADTMSQNNDDKVEVLWARMCQITERLQLAVGAHKKLSELQQIEPDDQKVNLLKSLNDEMILLSIVKSQLEESIAHAVAPGGISNQETPTVLPRIPPAHNSTNPSTHLSGTQSQHPPPPLRLLDGVGALSTKASSFLVEPYSYVPVPAPVPALDTQTSISPSTVSGDQDQGGPNGFVPVSLSPPFSPLDLLVGIADTPTWSSEGNDQLESAFESRDERYRTSNGRNDNGVDFPPAKKQVLRPVSTFFPMAYFCANILSALCA